MVIQHGATSGCGVAANNGSRFFGVGFLPMISDKMAVAGRISRDWLSANGVPEEKLVVTGMPQFDKYYGYGRDVSGARRNICRRFGFDERKALVLFAAQHFNDEKRLSGYQYTACETYTLLKELAAAAGSADINLIIKMHPASYEAESFYSDIMESFGLRNYAVTKHEGTDELVLAADAVITPWSTVGLEALLMDKFLVTVNLTGTPDRMPYAEEGAAKGVYSQKELKDIFLRIERDKGGAVDWQALKKFKNDYNARGERTASENCAQLILSSVKK
jgi:CDP-glycerol glycerophosphotransferase (TagB/SpsB family)